MCAADCSGEGRSGAGCDRRALSMKPDERRSRIPTCAVPAWPQAQQAKAPARTRADQRLTPSMFCPSSNTVLPLRRLEFRRAARPASSQAAARNSCRIRLPRRPPPVPKASMAKRLCECARLSFQQSRRFLTFLAGWNSSPAGGAPRAHLPARLPLRTMALGWLLTLYRAHRGPR